MADNTGQDYTAGMQDDDEFSGDNISRGTSEEDEGI